MKLAQFKHQMDLVPQINFVLPNGTFIPSHFHITEAGLTTKQFIDCGGTVRTEKSVSFQVWVAGDLDHKLEPQKLTKIIDIYEKLFGSEDLEIEVEYQAETIGRYGLEMKGNVFVLTAKQTNCLAKEHCGSPPDTQDMEATELQSAQTTCCSPAGGCC